METREQDVLAALRAATAERHAELDAHTPLAAPGVDLAAYSAHLRLLEQWLAPVPAWLNGFGDGPVLPDYLGAIRADLAHGALASGAPGAAIALVSSVAAVTSLAPATSLASIASSAGLPGKVAYGLPSLPISLSATSPAGLSPAGPMPWPEQASAAYRWGVCYVVEGSQLGGAVLYKRLGTRLAPHPLAYLRGNGSPGPRWQQFLAALRTHVAEPQQIADACAGARDAFDRLIDLNRATH